MALDKDLSLSQTETRIDQDITDSLSLWKAPLAVQYATSFVMTAMATAIAAGFDRYEAIPNLSLIYVVPVVAASVMFGLGPALVCAVLGALAYNFFFTEPRFSLAVADTPNIWAIALFFVIGCITSAIASLGRRRATDLQRHRRAQEAIRTYAREMTATRSIDEAAMLTTATLKSLFHAPVALVLVAHGPEELKIEGEGGLTAIEIEAARSSLMSNTMVNAGIYPFDESRFDFWPVATVSDRSAAIGLALDPERRPADPEAIIEIIAYLLGATIDRYGNSATATKD